MKSLSVWVMAGVLAVLLMLLPLTAISQIVHERIVVFLAMALVGIGVIAAAIDIAWQWKFEPRAFQGAIQQVAREIEASSQPDTRVFIVAAPRSFYVEAYESFGIYLRHALRGQTKFDLYSDLPADSRFNLNPKAEWAYQRNAEPGIPRHGDILIGLPGLGSVDPSWQVNAKEVARFSAQPAFLLLSLDEAIAHLKKRLKPKSADPIEADVEYRVYVRQ